MISTSKLDEHRKMPIATSLHTSDRYTNRVTNDRLRHHHNGQFNRLSTSVKSLLVLAGGGLHRLLLEVAGNDLPEAVDTRQSNPF